MVRRQVPGPPRYHASLLILRHRSGNYRPAGLKIGSSDQQHQHHQGLSLKCNLPGFISELFNQKSRGWYPAISISDSGNSDEYPAWRTTVVDRGPWKTSQQRGAEARVGRNRKRADSRWKNIKGCCQVRPRWLWSQRLIPGSDRVWLPPALPCPLAPVHLGEQGEWLTPWWSEKGWGPWALLIFYSEFQ